MKNRRLRLTPVATALVAAIGLSLGTTPAMSQTAQPASTESLQRRLEQLAGELSAVKAELEAMK